LLKKLTGAFLLRIIGYLYQPLLVPILVMILGLPGYGQLSSAMAVAAIAMAFCEYGHSASLGSKIVAHSLARRDNASAVIYSIVAYQKIILLIVATGLIFLWANWSVQGYFLNGWLLIILISCVVAPEAITPAWYYIGTGRLTRLLVYQLIGRAVAFVIACWLAYKKILITTADAALLCGVPFLVASLLSNNYLWRTVKPKLASFNSIKMLTDMVRQVPYFLGAFSSSITPSIFILLVATYFSKETLGQYAIAGVAWSALRQLSQLGSNIYLSSRQWQPSEKIHNLVVKASGLGIFCSFLTVFLIWLIDIFLSKNNLVSIPIDYSFALNYLFVLSVSVIFYSINFSIGLYIFCANNKRIKFTLTQALPMFTLVLLSFFWKDLKPFDIAVFMGVAELFGLLMALFIVRDNTTKVS